MKNEIIDKLKNAGYITVTDDSQEIADKIGVSGGSIDDLKNAGLITKTTSTSVIEEEIGIESDDDNVLN